MELWRRDFYITRVPANHSDFPLLPSSSVPSVHSVVNLRIGIHSPAK
jgi:hypothetical protein